MARRYQYFSASERLELWRRWHKGENFEQIARTLGRGRSSVRCFFRERGGIEPRQRVRSEHVRAIEQQRSARDLCASAGWDEQRVSMELLLGGYLLGASMPQQAS